MKDAITVLLTGATGYVGSAWLQQPAARVSKVVLLVRNPAGETIHTRPGISTVVQQGSIPETLPEDLLGGVDVVIHLAQSLTPDSGPEADPEQDERWTRSLGAACKERGIAFIFASTGALYQNKTGDKLTEQAPAEPHNAYTRSKGASEQVLLSLAQEGLPLAIVRFGSIFGPGPAVNYNRAVNKFVAEAAAGVPMSVWSTAMSQMRPYTYIGDCVAAINFIIDRNLFSGDIYNVVSENATGRTIVEEIVRQVPGARVEVRDSVRMNELSYGMDDAKIRSLGFTPRGTLKAGIQELLSHLSRKNI